jgi:hypothetical protein
MVGVEFRNVLLGTDSFVLTYPLGSTHSGTCRVRLKAGGGWRNETSDELNRLDAKRARHLRQAALSVVVRTAWNVALRRQILPIAITQAPRYYLRMSKKNPAAVALGKLGRAAMTKAQAAASRRNGKRGGRPIGSKDSRPRKRRKS